MKWTILESANEVAHAACDLIVQVSKKAIAERGQFHIVLAGGNTPARTYALLTMANCDWGHWHLWFGDERCLPDGDPGRNSVMVDRELTSKVAIPAAQIHVIPAESGPEVASSDYAELLAGVPPFDMVLLGMGEDGHTASLFPGHKWPTEKTVLPIINAPKFPEQRVSLSPEVLGQCRQLLFIITGKDKRTAVKRWKQGETLPVSLIHTTGSTEVLIDRAAFPGDQF